MPRMRSRDAVEVCVCEKGYVCIKQENLHEDDSIIMLQPDQVPTIMTWLDEAMGAAAGNDEVSSSKRANRLPDNFGTGPVT